MHHTQVHKESQFFHSDFAHSDYNTKTSSVSWESPSFDGIRVVGQGSVPVRLWLSTNAGQTECTATLSSVSGGKSTTLCSASANTAKRAKDEHPVTLPGDDMMRTSMSGGFAVLMTMDLKLKQVVRLAKGDRLRLDISGGGGAEDDVNHRIWHNPKWQSSIELNINEAVELKWAPATA